VTVYLSYQVLLQITQITAKPKASNEPASPTRCIMRQSYDETVYWYRDSFKIYPTHNPVGAIVNCFHQDKTISFI
jgi:hypothetical protein